MAQKIVVTISSDLGGEVDAHKVDFGYGGTAYEIDLTEAEDKELHELLAPYLNVARKVAGKHGRPAKASTSVAASGGSNLTPTERTAVREYAASHGVQLNARGRLPSLAVTAWQTGNPEVLEHLKAKQAAV